jgi:hypothetical protein
MLSMPDTMVPMIFMSNRTHPLNFGGNKNEWPVYMAIGNLSAKLCQMPSTHSIVMVALLSILIENSNNPAMWLNEQQHTNRDMLNKVLQQLLQPLSFKQYPGTVSGY